jgi:tRNA threonylcarbamoyladenosine biosynthesis protein TsaB
VNILAFDCSMTGCAAAILAGERVLGRGEAPASEVGRGQSEALMPLLAQAMAAAGLDWKQLDLIGVTVGPGSFTGLRIGLAAARGFSLALGVRIAGVATPEALAAGIPTAERGSRPVIVAIDSKRADLFVQPFDPGLKPIAAVTALPAEQAARLAGETPLLVGDAAPRLLPFVPGAMLSAAPPRPDPAALARLAARLSEEGRALPAEPLYLRPADVTLPAAAS